MILHVRAAVERLYAAPVDRFTALRAELAMQARAAGDRELAREIGRLRKPTVAAWALNRFVRDRPDALDELGRFALDLREAQRTLDPERLRTLGRERGARVEEAARVVEDAARSEGVPLGSSVVAEVRESLTAFVVDEEAERAVRTGALVRPLAYSGFGSVEIEGAVAVEPGAPGAAAPEGDTRAAGSATVADLAERRRARREAERAGLVRRLDDAHRAASRAAGRVAALETRRDDVRAGIEDLSRRLDAARDRLGSVERELDDAERERDRSSSREHAARDALARFDAGTGDGD